MIIVKTPFRISFFGGGTDYPSWYNSNHGKTISTSINKYSYVTLAKLPKFFNYNYRIRYYYREEKKYAHSIKHPTIRNALKLKKFSGGLSIYHYGELPARTGIGSSSSFTVGILKGLDYLQKRKSSLKKIYTEAIYLEQKMNKEPVGSQDQIITTVGGFCIINYYKNKITIKKLKNYKNNIKKIENCCILVYTGKQRNSNSFSKKNINLILKNKKYYKELYKIACKAEKLISSKKFNIEKFADLLDESWKMKVKTSKSITNNRINNLYNLAKKNGAMAGKLLGAGHAGFMLFLVKKKCKDRFLSALKKKVIVDLKFENSGTKILYENN